MPEYVTQAEYARHRKVSRVTIFRRTTTAGGPIPVYGPRKLIRVAEADALWVPTMATQGLGTVPPATSDPPSVVTGNQLAQARAAALVVDVQTKRLLLERTRGALISRDRATLKCFAYTRMIRDSWLNWPSRVGPLVAAAFDLDAGAVTVMLDGHVRTHLADLASERLDF